MNTVYSELGEFEKRLKERQGVGEEAQDSSEEEEVKEMSELDRANEKIRILINKLFKAEKNSEELQSQLDTITGSGQADNKDKKIIELAKRNRNLQLQVESLKTKAAKAAEHALKLQNENQTPNSPQQTKSPQKLVNLEQTGELLTEQEMRKKFKESEKKMIKMRNDNQQLKLDLEKAHRVLEKEVGEIVDIDQMLADGTSWKGRAQKIEVLKAKVKTLNEKYGENMSVMSDATVVTQKTHAERNLGKMEKSKQAKVDQMQKQLDETLEELGQIKQKYKAVMARRDMLEKQAKEKKLEFQNKGKMLIEKSENDDRLIRMLKEEVLRLEKGGGKVKSSLASAGASSIHGTETEETKKLSNQVKMLQNEVYCTKVKLEDKERQIQNMMHGMVGSPNENLEESQVRVAELEDQVEKLERELYRLKQTGGSKPKTEQDSLVKELSKENAVLRRKLDDAKQKLVS